MTMPRVLFRDGYDAYVDDLEFIQDTVETELQNRMKDITLSGGVAVGLTPTPVNDAVSVTAGDAYTELDRSLIRLLATTQVAVGASDTNKFVVIENVPTDSLSDTHPILLTVAFRRKLQVATLSVVTSPTTSQVKLAKITAVSAGNPPTIDTAAPNREILSLGVGTQGGSVTNPFIVVANDGSGDHTTLAAAVAALPSTGGRIVVKSGTYDITSVQTINKSNVKVEGSGPATLFRVVGVAATMFHAVAINGSGVGGISNIVFENIAFDWNGAGGVDPGAGQDNMAIRVVEATDVTIRRCYFKDSLGVTNPKGFKCETGVARLKILECFFNTLNKGILLNASASGNDCIIRDCSGTGLRFGIHADANYDRVSVGNCNFVGDGNAASRGIQIDDTCDDWAVAGGNIISNFNVGVQVDGDGVAVVGNAVIGNSTGVSFTSTCSKAVGAGNNLRNNSTTGIVNTGDAGNIITPNIT